MRCSVVLKSHLPILLLVSTIAVSGCFVRIGGSRRCRPCAPEPTCPEESDSKFKARIDAAQSIRSSSRRDSALAVIAIDAARVLDVCYTVKALSLMSSSSRRSSAAEKCADLFLDSRMIEEARKVAGQVSSSTTRDRILSKIAQTPAPRPPEEKP